MERPPSRWPYLALSLANLLLAYALFHTLGSLLLRLPSSFHDHAELGLDAHD